MGVINPAIAKRLGPILGAYLWLPGHDAHKLTTKSARKLLVALERGLKRGQFRKPKIVKG